MTEQNKYVDFLIKMIGSKNVVKPEYNSDDDHDENSNVVRSSIHLDEIPGGGQQSINININIKLFSS